MQWIFKIIRFPKILFSTQREYIVLYYKILGL